MTNAEYAKAYLDRGWSVIPLKGAGHEKPKSPFFNEWRRFSESAPTIGEINTWFKNNARGVGIITGKFANLYVLDLDPDCNLEFMLERYGLDLGSPNVVKTGRGGYHFYFHGDGTPLGLRVGMFPHVDFRGEGGFVAAPGTVHESGNPYVWQTGEIPLDLPPIPPLLVQDVLSKKPGTYDEQIEEGGRDNALTQLVGKLFAKGHNPSEVLVLAQALNNTYCKPPLPTSDVKRIVDSISGREETKKTPTKEFELKSFDFVMRHYGNWDQEWLIKDWLPSATCGMLGSAPGMFKTWMLMDLAISVASGADFLGMFPVSNPGTVVIIQQEDPLPMLVKRTAQILNVGEFEGDINGNMSVSAPPSLPIFYHTERSLRFEDESIRRSFTAKMHEIKPRLILIDPLYSAAKTEDYMAQAAQDMLFLKTLRDDIGSSSFIAHHMGKTGDEKKRARDSFWGSQFLNAWIETGWELAPIGAGLIEVTRHFKTAEIPPPVGLGFEIGEGTYNVRVLGDEPTFEEKVTALVVQGEAVSIGAVCRATGVASKSKVQIALRKIGAVLGSNGYFIPGPASMEED